MKKQKISLRKRFYPAVRLRFFLWLALFILSCSSARKLNMLRNHPVSAEVAPATEDSPVRPAAPELSFPHPTEKDKPLEVRDPEGTRIIMNAVKDEQTGEMVPTEQLQAVVVEAKFRSVPERGGKVDIAFDISVPPAMQDARWQIRFRPLFYLSGDTLRLDEVHITGARYRAAQLRGYELYRKYLSAIIPDTCDFTDYFTYRRLLEIFIDRNFKNLSRLRYDSSVTDSGYARSLFGTTEKEAIEHYTKNWLVRRNDKRKLNREKMYKKYIKTPLITDRIRLDSVITEADGSLCYHYVQTVGVRSGLRRVDMVLSGSIFEEEREIYTMPQTDPLTFYISSIAAFTDDSPRYIKRITERRAEAHTAAYIDFRAGRHEIEDTLSGNTEEIGRIKENIRQVLSNEDFIVDSLVITASCSPEGNYRTNVLLAQNRAIAIKKYFAAFVARYRDSLKNSVWNLELQGTGAKEGSAVETVEPEIEENSGFAERMRTRSIPEEWERLKKLAYVDTAIRDLPALQKCFLIPDPDLREKALSRTADYLYLRKYIYPLLRTVKFDFYLHRRGMIKDTVHTTEIDTAYMAGVKALRDRDYKRAVAKLRPYNDFNTAVAYVCLDYNRSALAILEKLPASGRRDYMLAVLYSRLGDEKKAVEYYIHSVYRDPSMRYRGNLDPEISSLIKKYNIN